MANAKKKKSDAECKAQFERTVKRTGKWRGYTPDAYFKRFGASGFRSGHGPTECSHHFSDGVCINCGERFKNFVKKHPKIAARIYGVIIKKTV